MKLFNPLPLLLGRLFRAVAILAIVTFQMQQLSAATGAEDSAREVLRRLIGDRANGIKLETIAPAEDRDVFEVGAENGVLTVKGSSAVALCRGFYDYLKTAGLGITTWTRTRLALPDHWPDAGSRRVVCPYKYRYYFNVVTYGYTMPYWTWDRWEREIDWMALHGVNMPLALVGTEAIGERVWKKIGLAQKDIDAFYTGPAFLPWQRMGNITSYNGPLPEGWNADQIALQHKILERMRALGMEPIVPAFAGFVPRQLKSIYPGAELYESIWGGAPKPTDAWILSPDSPVFTQIGKSFVEEWEKEFGRCRFFLADSFNEMPLPKTGKPATEMLANYGSAIYKSIAAGDPNAVWTIQGWMFGQKRNIWTPETVKALLSKVPDDRMLILDLANDYTDVLWHVGSNWEHFNGFYGKPWVYSVIPNMGGKTAYNGILDFYATDPARVLKSPNRGSEIGFGFAPEGIENNDVIYELLSDVAWRGEPVKLDDWIANYCTDRYGSYPPEVKHAWDLLRQSCYGTFVDHPRFGWQIGAFSGPINHDPKFMEAVESFLAASNQLGKIPLYRDDAIEMTAIYLGIKADDWFRWAHQAQGLGKTEIRDESLSHGLELLTGLDRLLESHPNDRLERWLDFARSHGTTDAEKHYYESDARNILTIWVNNYSARMWSGLVRDFYRERMARYFDSQKNGKPFKPAAFGNEWVRASGISPCEPFADPLDAAKTLVSDSNSWPIPYLPSPGREK